MSKSKVLLNFLKISFRISKSYIFLVILQSLFLSIIPIVNMVFPKLIIDELIGEKDLDKLIYLVIFILSINLLLNIINNSFKRIMNVKNNYINLRFSEEMSKKVLNLDFEKIEDPELLNLKERAKFAAINHNSIQNLINSISSILKSTFSLIGIITIMLTFEIWIIGFLMLIVFLLILLNLSFKKYQVKFFTSLMPINRVYGHYINRCFDLDNSKDIRLYNLNKILLKTSVNYSDEIFRWFKKFFLKSGINRGLTTILTYLQQILIYLYLAYKTLKKSITLGSFTMYAQASTNFTKMTTEIFSSFATINQMCEYLTPFMEFMNLDSAKSNNNGIVLDEDIKTIEFNNVTFNYPRIEKTVLNGLSFKINEGDKVSIVGLNGSGKTTLVKLLCRLYTPTTGEILVNGRNILEYNYLSYMKKIATVFQDYKIFAFSFKDNIILNNDFNENNFNNVIDKIELNDTLSKLKNGIHSNIKKDFDINGTELSGGQNQKVAIARALYKESDVIILDEPTSALDPIAEYEIYNHFNNLVSNKTSIYISHRMSSSIFSDRILVIDQGKAIAYDTHQKLLQLKDGLYYKLYMTQAKNYKLPNQINIKSAIN